MYLRQFSSSNPLLQSGDPSQTYLLKKLQFYFQELFFWKIEKTRIWLFKERWSKNTCKYILLVDKKIVQLSIRRFLIQLDIWRNQSVDLLNWFFLVFLHIQEYYRNPKQLYFQNLQWENFKKCFNKVALFFKKQFPTWSKFLRKLEIL